MVIEGATLTTANYQSYISGNQAYRLVKLFRDNSIITRNFMDVNNIIYKGTDKGNLLLSYLEHIRNELLDDSQIEYYTNETAGVTN